MKLKIIFMEVSESNVLPHLINLVSPEKRKKLERFRFSIDRNLSLYAELLVRQNAVKTLGITNNDVVLGTNEYGKPFLESYSNFHFNISHTRNAIVVAFANTEIGVDIEQIKPNDLKIADRFFTLEETRYIHNNPNHDRAFFEIWTKKEAYIKCKGKGLSLPLTSFSALDEDMNEMTQTIEESGYIISVCASAVVKTPLTFIHITESNFLKSLNVLED